MEIHHKLSLSPLAVVIAAINEEEGIGPTICELGWKPKSKGFGIEIELNYFVERLGYEIVEIPIIYKKRLGKKKLGFRHGLKILRRIIIESI